MCTKFYWDPFSGFDENTVTPDKKRVLGIGIMNLTEISKPFFS